MRISADLTDAAVLQELGRRLARARVDAGLTQAQAAQEAGIAKRTLERLEAGHAVDSVTLIRLLRALKLSANLESLVPDVPQSPVALLKSKGRQRVRARQSRRKEGDAWSWGD